MPAWSVAGPRGQGEGQCGYGGVVVGGLDRGPADDVVLVADGLGVERLEGARAAGPHALDRAATGEVADAARAVGGRAPLDLALPRERARQVRRPPLHAGR